MLGDCAFQCSQTMITPGSDDYFNFEQSSLRINMECAFGQLIRRWEILWCHLEMNFWVKAAVIGCWIHLHNFCISAGIELEKELSRANRKTEAVPGRMMEAQIVNEEGRPVEHIHLKCRCSFCSSSTRDTAWTDGRRRNEIERDIRERGLKRPYRCN